MPVQISEQHFNLNRMSQGTHDAWMSYHVLRKTDEHLNLIRIAKLMSTNCYPLPLSLLEETYCWTLGNGQYMIFQRGAKLPKRE